MFLAPTPIHFHEGISDRQDVHFERPERTHPLGQSRYLVYFLFLLWAFFCNKFILRGTRDTLLLVQIFQKKTTLFERYRERVIE